jgi:hypothetical protein
MIPSFNLNWFSGGRWPLLCNRAVLVHPVFHQVLLLDNLLGLVLAQSFFLCQLTFKVCDCVAVFRGFSSQADHFSVTTITLFIMTFLQFRDLLTKKNEFISE